MKYLIIWVPLVMALCLTESFHLRDSLAQNGSDPKLSQIPASGKTSGTITLAWAVEKAVKNHPSVAATKYEIKARQGAEQQAGLYPNPVLFGEVEEFSGSGDFSGTDAMSSRIGISQEFLLGGKIDKRVHEAKAATRIAGLEHQTKIMEIRALVQTRFFEVFTLQERLRLSNEQFDLILKTHDVVVKRVKTGDTSPMDLARSRVDLESAKLESQKINTALETARYALAETWGSKTPVFSTVSARFLPPEDFTEYALKQALKQSPAWLLLEEQITSADAVVDLAKAQRIPDIELEGGVQSFNETGDQAYFMGISIPLPLFDRNQGAIAEAEAIKNKAQHQRIGGFLSLHTELQQVWRNLVSTRQTVQSMEANLLPAAQQAYDAIVKAYKAGEVDILDMLDAQTTWVETRKTRLELLHELEINKIELERLVGDATASDVDTSQNIDSSQRHTSPSKG